MFYFRGWCGRGCLSRTRVSFIDTRYNVNVLGAYRRQRTSAFLQRRRSTAAITVTYSLPLYVHLRKQDSYTSFGIDYVCLVVLQFLRRPMHAFCVIFPLLLSGHVEGTPGLSRHLTATCCFEGCDFLERLQTGQEGFLGEIRALKVKQSLTEEMLKAVERSIDNPCPNRTANPYFANVGNGQCDDRKETKPI